MSPHRIINCRFLMTLFHTWTRQSATKWHILCELKISTQSCQKKNMKFDDFLVHPIQPRPLSPRTTCGLSKLKPLGRNHIGWRFTFLFYKKKSATRSILLRWASSPRRLILCKLIEICTAFFRASHLRFSWCRTVTKCMEIGHQNSTNIDAFFGDI